MISLCVKKINKLKRKSMKKMILKEQRKISAEKLVENLKKMTNFARIKLLEQLAMVEIIGLLEELLEERFSTEQEVYDRMVAFCDDVELALTNREMSFKEKVASLEEKMVRGKVVQEYNVVICFSLQKTLISFGWSSDVNALQLVYNQGHKLYYANHRGILEKTPVIEAKQ